MTSPPRAGWLSDGIIEYFAIFAPRQKGRVHHRPDGIVLSYKDWLGSSAG